VLAANWLLNFSPAGSADPEPERSQANLEAGLRRTLDELDRHGFKVLLIAQSPVFPISVPHCLGRRPADACGVSRALVEERREHIMRVMRSVVERRPNARIFDPVPVLCGDKECPPIMGNAVGYRDRGHISAKASPVLGAAIEGDLDWLLSGKRP